MRMADFNGRVSISHTLISNQTDAIGRRFFFARNVAKSGRFISDLIDMT